MELLRNAPEEDDADELNTSEEVVVVVQVAMLSAVDGADLRAAEHALNQGYGGVMEGALGGAAVGGLASNSGRGALAGGLIGAVAGTVVNAMVKDVSYSIITDIQLSERVKAGKKVRETDRAELKQGTSGSKKTTYSDTTDWKRYQTRIVSTANKVNLKFEQAAPELIAGLSRSIAGLL